MKFKMAINTLILETPGALWFLGVASSDSSSLILRGLQEGTLISILCQFVLKKIKINLWKVKSDVLITYYLYQQKLDNGDTRVLIDLASDYQVSPMAMARQILEYYYFRGETHKLHDGAYGLDVLFAMIPHISQQILLGTTCAQSDECPRTSTLVRDTSLIKDSRLSYEVYLASLNDLVQSNLANIIKRLVGREKEIYLENKLSQLGIAYKTEADLRSQGFNKTPDIILDVPIAVGNHVVKWIESKALFADEALHTAYFNIQLKNYLCFGPGIVIYWFGFIDIINNKYDKVLVFDDFPEEIIQME